MTSSGSAADSSLLIWIVAAVVVGLALHVALEWARVLQRREGWRDKWQGVLLAGGVLGTGISAAAVLSLTGESLPFQFGYQAALAPLLWLGAVIGSVLICAWLARNPSLWSQLAAGVVLALLILAVQMGWITAVGFRPGIRWNPEFTTAAAMLLVVGCCCCLWFAHPGFLRDSDHRRMWKIGIVALMGITVVGAQEILCMRIGFAVQVGSLYQRQLPASVVSMLCGLLLPLILLVLSLDLMLRRRELKHSRGHSRQSAALPQQQRRKRRRRVHSL